MVHGMNALPRVHVGIVTYNSLADLPRCLAALRAQTYPEITLTLHDNASTDGSAAWAKAEGLDVIENATNVGFARGHNLILGLCEPGEFYMPLNPDVTLTPEYITTLVQIIAEKGAGWATGKLLWSEQSNPPTIYSVGHGIRRDGYFYNIGYMQADCGQFDSPCEVFGAPGAAPLISAALMTDLAPDGELFDSVMFLYGEDTDLDWRARRHGWRCWYTPKASAYHRGSAPGSDLRAQAIANRYLSVLKNAYWVDLLTYNLPIIVVHILLRVIFTPRPGLRMAALFWGHSVGMIQKRTSPRVTRSVLRGWFLANAESGQPIGWRARLRRFFKASR
jgi:GT2 family glycosyltransferase